MTSLTNDDECPQMSAHDLAYHTSEQYLILCLRLCRLILNNNCTIHRIIVNTSNASSSSTLMFLNLNELECAKYAHRETYKLSLFVAGLLLCLLIMGLNARFTLSNIRKKWSQVFQKPFFIIRDETIVLHTYHHQRKMLCFRNPAI